MNLQTILNQFTGSVNAENAKMTGMGAGPTQRSGSTTPSSGTANYGCGLILLVA